MVEQAQGALGGRWRAAGRGLIALVAAFALHPAFADDSPQDPSWDALAPTQREILAPLAAEWNRLDPASRKRWLGVAKRYPKMTPIGQKRVQTRMTKWAALTPQQRAEARANYQTMKRKRASGELQREWQRYQALSPGEREALAAGERTSKAKPKAKTKRPGASSAPGAGTFSQ